MRRFVKSGVKLFLGSLIFGNVAQSRIFHSAENELRFDDRKSLIRVFAERRAEIFETAFYLRENFFGVFVFFRGIVKDIRFSRLYGGNAEFIG